MESFAIRSLTPSDIERLWREHKRMLEALRDIGFRLPTNEQAELARAVCQEVNDNAVR